MQEKNDGTVLIINYIIIYECGLGINNNLLIPTEIILEIIRSYI